MAAALQKTRPLSVESFSYTWMVNLNPSLDQSLEDSFRRASIDASDEASFIEMDPNLSPSKRFSRVPNKYCNFDFPTSRSPSVEVYDDQFIYTGYLMPLFVKPLMKMEPYGTSEFIFATPISSAKHNEVHVFSRLRCASVRRCQRLSKQISEKYFDFLRPFCQKMRSDRSGSTRPGNTMKKAKVQRDKVKNCHYSPANSVDNWRKSCDSESSIHEAVLHCKRTIGK